MQDYKLRLPQEDVKSQIALAVGSGHKKILVMAPTGFGKTILAYDIIKGAISKGNKVLFTAHRITLAEQSAKKFSRLDPQYLQGENKDFDDNYSLLVATIQTLSSSNIAPPKIIIIDEVHYAYESHLIQSLFDKFPDAIVIGLSATPVDNKGYLLDGFDKIIDTYQTKDLISMGWLTPFECYAPMSIDTSKARISKATNDFVENDIEEIINDPIINESIVDNYIKHGQDRKFICFAVNHAHCIDLMSEFDRKGIPVEFIVATTKKKDRDSIFRRFASGQLKGIISIEILTAGFDDPTVSCVIMATATKAWKKYVQCAGRGIRLNGNSIEESIANGKSNCLFLDCCGNIEEHGMPDDRKELKFGVKISRVIDRELDLDFSNDARTSMDDTLTEEKQVFLKKIGSLLDLYDGKVYTNESALQDDVNSFLKKTGYFWWRQTSGKAFMNGRWVHFASKSGLPDNSVMYAKTSIFIGMELKLPKGYLTKHQRVTLPEMIRAGVIVFICESVYDVYKAIEHIEMNVTVSDEGVFINNNIYNMPERQLELRKRLKLE